MLLLWFFFNKRRLLWAIKNLRYNSGAGDCL